MKDLKFYGEIKDGKLVLDNPDIFREAIARCRDKPVVVEVRKQEDDVTRGQWGYLYGSAYRLFADHFGWSVDDVDKYMKREFMKYHGMILPDGMTLTKSSFGRGWVANYIDFVLNKCGEEGVVVPPADPRWKENIYQEDENV